MPALNWDASFTTDGIVSALPIPPGGRATGQLVDATGKAASEVSVSAASVPPSPIDPSNVFFCILKDIDGTACETPPQPSDGNLPLRSVEDLYASIGDITGPIFLPLGAQEVPCRGGSRGRVITIPSYLCSGFKVLVYNRTLNAIVVTVRYKQATT